MANFLAEGVGFEPTSPFREAVFKTAALNHSAIPPQFQSIFSQNFREPLIIINLSLPLRRESSDVKSFWIPAFAGMTFLELAVSVLKIPYVRRVIAKRHPGEKEKNDDLFLRQKQT